MTAPAVADRSIGPRTGGPGNVQRHGGGATARQRAFVSRRPWSLRR